MKTFLKRQVSDFNFFFCFLTNAVFLKQGFVWNKHVLGPKTFYYISQNKSVNNFLLKFLNQRNKFWSFFWNIISTDHALMAGFFVELELTGLGFRIRKITSTIFRFFWGYATFVYLFVPADVLVEYTAEGRSIFFFSLNPSAVNGFSSYLMLLKKISNYRVTGFVRPGNVIRLNSGKQR